MLMGVLAGCEALGQPVVALTTQICPFPLPGAPPFGAGMPPARDEAGRDAAAEVQALVRGLFDQGLPALNAARAALGLAPLATLTDQLDAARAVLLATSEAFDFPWTARPAHVRYVGPQISDPAWAGDWTSPWAKDDPRPLVLVGFSSTFQDHTAVLQRVLDALGSLDVRVLLTTGVAVAPEELTAPANAVVVRHAPHVKVMPEATLVVTHGGHGTVIRALAQGLPLLVMPHGRDQNDNATRVAARGAGLRLDAKAPVEDILAALRRLLTEPGFDEAARRLGAQVAEDAASSTLEEELEALAVSADVLTP
jgi:MGT family glycosyltransferase